MKKPISSYLDHPKLRLHCNILTIKDYEGIIITCGKLKTKLIIKIETYSVIWQKYYTQGFQNRFMSFTCLYCICYAAFKMYPFHLKTTRGYFSDIVTKQTCCTHQPELLVQAIYLFRIIAGSPKQATQEITLLTQ